MRNERGVPEQTLCAGFCGCLARVSWFWRSRALFISRCRGVFLTCLLAAVGTPALCEQITVVDRDAHYPEGPVWHDGRLFYVEYSTGSIKAWDRRVGSVFWHADGCGPSGLIARGSDLVVACYDGNYLAVVDGTGKETAVLRTDSNGRAFAGPNDFTADDRGGVYFSASGVYDIKAPITGAVLYLRPDGHTITPVANLVHYSNGLTLTQDRHYLLVAEMLAGRVLSFPILADGELGERTVWARLQDIAPPTPHEDAYNGPDGLKLGPDGNYYVAQNGSGRVLVVDGLGKLVRIITVPTPFVTNIAFGDGGAVFVTGVFDEWKAPYPGAVYRWGR